MFVGEIGINRYEFLNDLTFWEIRSIIRGYNERHHAGWEQARLVAYNAHYAMGSKEPPPSLDKWLTFPWEHAAEVEQSVIEELQAEMAAAEAM